MNLRVTAVRHLASYRISFLPHERTNGGYDAVYMRLHQNFPSKGAAAPITGRTRNNEIKKIVARLRRDGYMFFPNPYNRGCGCR